MKTRCTNRNSDDFVNYGGRGIRIYPEWRNDYAAFRNYVLAELGERPAGYSLDRIDNDGNYAPGNLRWADKQIQNRNRRRRF